MPQDVTPIAHPGFRDAPDWLGLLEVADAEGLVEALTARWQDPWYDAELPNAWTDVRGRIMRGLNLTRVRDVLQAPRLRPALEKAAGVRAAAEWDRALRIFLSRSSATAARRRRTLEAMRRLPDIEDAADLPMLVGPPITAPELDRWADHFGVLDVLDAPAAKLTDVFDGPGDAWLQRRGADTTVRDALTADSFRGSVWRPRLRSVPIGIQQQLAFELRALAASRLAPPDAVDSTPPRPQEGPRGDAYDRLLEVRAWLAQGRPPPPRDAWENAVIWWWEDPPRLVVSFESCDRHATSVEVLPRAVPTDAVRCECPARLRRTCPDALRAVQAALAVIAQPPTPDARRVFEEDLGRPSWQSAFQALDAALGDHGIHEVASAAAEHPLGWRLNHAQRPWKLQPVVCKPRRQGGWTSTLATRDAFKSGGVRFELPVDREIAERVCPELLTGGLTAQHHPRQVLFALPLLAAHPRVFLGGRGGPPLTVRRGALTLSVEQRRDGGVVVDPRLGGRSLRPPELQRLADHDVVGAPAPLLDVEAATCVLVDLTPAAVALLRILRDRGMDYDATAAAPLLERLPRIEQAIPVQLASQLRGVQLPPDTRLRVRLEPQAGLGVSMRLRPLPGGPVVLPGEGPEALFGEVDGERAHVLRDLDDEAGRARALAAAVGLTAVERVGPSSWFVEEPEAIARVVDGLKDRDDVIHEWTGRRRLRVSRATTLSDLKLRVRDLAGWFSLDGRFEVDEESVSLADVLLALEHGRRYVRLDADGWLALDDAVRSHLTDAFAGTLTRRGERGVTPMHAPAVDRLRTHGVHIEAPDTWSANTARIEEAAASLPRVPDGLRAELRTYQVDGFRWAARLASWAPGAVLADDMGLGKTLQAIALLLYRAGSGPALVVAPTSVGYHWVREIERFAPGLRPILHRGPRRADDLSHLGASDVVVTSWDLMVRDQERMALPWATLVLDEAQAVKTASTRRAKASRALTSGFCLALTGTPVENHAGELWSLFHTVCPGLLGSAEQFRQRFGGPIATGNNAARAALAAAVRPFLLRRLKSEVARELPPRTEIELSVTLTEGGRRVYEAARRVALDRLRAAKADPDLARKLRFMALADLTRLRRLACHPALGDPDSKARSAKIERLLELVAQLREEGHQALVFSQFVGLLRLARAALEDAGAGIRWIDGATPLERRQEEVDRFQSGDGDVFLISLKAGGTGLNLTSATYVIHLDPWWNPAAEDQATDRAHRIGQDQPVTVYRLIAEDTVEAGVLELQAAKRELIQGLLEGTGRAAPFSADELIALLQGTRAPAGEPATLPPLSRAKP